MKTQRKGQISINLAENIVIDQWESRWQPIEAHNDDGIDALIFIERGGEITGQIVYVQVKYMKPLIVNSDHANFAAHGIPALRLLAGFDEPTSNLRYLLTAADTHLLTNVRELKAGALTAGAVMWQALQADDEVVRALRTC